MVRLGMGVFLAACFWAGCQAEKFVSPDKPDLYKVPYDFAPARDLTGADLSADAPDLDANAHDLASPDDLDEHD